MNRSKSERAPEIVLLWKLFSGSLFRGGSSGEIKNKERLLVSLLNTDATDVFFLETTI